MREIVHNSSISVLASQAMALANHAEFEELCALVTTGELTDDEWARLHAHLKYCDVCRQALKEHIRIESEVLPIIAAQSDSLGLDSESSFDVYRGERRLMEALRDRESEAERKRKERIRRLLGISAAFLLVGGGITLTRPSLLGRHEVASLPRPSVSAPFPESRPQSAAGDAQAELRKELERTKLSLAATENRLKDESSRRDQFQAKLQNLAQQLDLLKQDNHDLAAQKEQLGQQLVAAQTELTSSVDRANSASVVSAVQISELHSQIQKLNTALEDRSRSVAERNELLAHDRDIRDLIGARNLLIAEIYDVAQTGSRAKPFGRIFYTKGKSLVFYGYDLDKQSGLKHEASFQAWGSSSNGQSVSLGIFYQDDSNRRWILKFDDAKTLAHLNSVFVTVEPEGGSAKPTGKPLLVASLQIEPNHP